MADTDDEENYFGSGRQGFGEGVDDYQPNRSFGYSWRDSTGYSSYDYPERRYESLSKQGRFGRDAYGLGYDREFDYGRRHRRPGPERYAREEFRRTGYEPEYQSSERGFENTGDRSWWERASDEVSSWFGDEEAGHRRRMDTRGGYRGRGPRNYTRSDERIREDINDRLTDYDYIDASDIEVEVNAGEVVLSGTVESRFEKRLAEDLAEDISGVRNVENRIRVQREHQSLENRAYDSATRDAQAEAARGRSASGLG
jgi:osmotically-inducible protein OsmY